MVKKIIGYVLALIGLAGVAITTFPELKAETQLPEELAGIALTDNTILVISAVILVIGILLSLKKSSLKKVSAEVPILEGNKVVGYRRQK